MFEELAALLIDVEGGEKAEITPEGATFEIDKKQWTYERQREIEKRINDNYPSLPLVSYLTTRYYEEEMYQELEVVIKVDDVMYVVSNNLGKIETGTLRSDVYEIEKDEYGDYDVITRGGGVEKKKVYAMYPEIEGILFSAIQEMPTYRLHFVTGSVEIETWKDDQ